MSTTKKPAKKAGKKADKKEDKKKLLTRPLRSVEARSKKKAQSDEKTLPSPELEAPQAGEQLVRCSAAVAQLVDNVKKYSLPVSLPAEAQLLENAKTKKGTLTAPAGSDPKTSKIVGMKPKTAKKTTMPEPEYMRVPEPEYMRSLLAGHIVYYSEGLKIVPVSQFPVINNNPNDRAIIFKGLRFTCPEWNPHPFDHIEGKPPSEDPYPIFSGTRKLKLPKKWPSFNVDLLRRRYALIDDIEIKAGAKAACQTRIVFDMLIGKQLHPNEAMRTLLAIFNRNPKYVFETCRVSPEGYSMDLITMEDGSGFIAAHISPQHVTYYCNSGAESLDVALYYQRFNKPKGRKINSDYHMQTAASLFVGFTGSKAVYLTDGGSYYFRIGRNVYDATIFELPTGWYPDFATEFSIQYKIPSNLPQSPNGEYYFAFLIWKLRNGHPLSDMDRKLFEAWFMDQTPSQEKEICNDIRSVGREIPMGCLKFMRMTPQEQAFHCRFSVPEIHPGILTALIDEGIFSREWAQALGLCPVVGPIEGLFKHGISTEVGPIDLIKEIPPGMTTEDLRNFYYNGPYKNGPTQGSAANMYYSKTCPPLEMLPIPESSARPVVPPANGKVSAQGTPVPVGPTIRILGPEYQFTGLSNVPPHPGTKFSPIIGFGWQGTSFEKFTAKLSKNSRAAVEEALGLPPGITLSDLTEGDVIYDKVDGFILKPGALPQIIERVGLKMTQGAARNPTPPQKGPFSEPPKPASELPPGLKKTTSGTGYAYVEDGTPDEIMIGFVGEDFAKPNSQKATEAQKQSSNGKLPTAATSTTAKQQQKDKKALTDFRSRSADPPPSRSPLSGPQRDLRGTPSMNFAKKSPPGLPPAAVIIGAKRVLPPGSIPEPEIPGLNRDKAPMTSFGMYGVDENTHQQYFSIGEWLVSEGSMMWKKLLRERGVTGKITEEIKNTGWVLVKKAASSRSPYSILYPEFDWLEADLLCRVDEVIKHVKALEDLARKNGDRMIEYLTTPPEQLVINTGTACQMEMARNEDIQVGAADSGRVIIVDALPGLRYSARTK